MTVRFAPRRVARVRVIALANQDVHSKEMFICKDDGKRIFDAF